MPDNGSSQFLLCGGKHGKQDLLGKTLGSSGYGETMGCEDVKNGIEGRLEPKTVQ
jgi:hypothetical protein